MKIGFTEGVLMADIFNIIHWNCYSSFILCLGVKEGGLTQLFVILILTSRSCLPPSIIN